MKKLTISVPEDSRDGMLKLGDPKPMKHKKDEPSFYCSFCNRSFMRLNQLESHLSCCGLRKAFSKDKPAANINVEPPPLPPPCSVNEKEAGKATIEDEDDDDEVPCWLDGVSAFYFQARSFAEASLEFFNEQADEAHEGNKYELVEPGPHYAVVISGGPIIHLNFKGKATDCPGAEVETFFAQIRMHPGQVVDCCVSLGPSHMLPHWSNADNRGCTYCGDKVQHPRKRCHKLMKGTNREEATWLYGDKHDSEDSDGYNYIYGDSDDSDCEVSSSD